MSMNVTETEIGGVRLITPPTVFEDHRGVYRELYNDKDYHPAVGHPSLRGAGPTNGLWVADDISTSYKGTLRGIHGDYKTWKLVSCLYGRFYLVVVDNRNDSPTYGRYLGLTLSDRNYLSVLIPPGCGNGHYILSDVAIFHYKQSEYYDREGQFTIPWDDMGLDIFWPIEKPITSERDESMSSKLKRRIRRKEVMDGRAEMLFGKPVVYNEEESRYDIKYNMENIQENNGDEPNVN